MDIIKISLQFKAMTKRAKTEDIILHHAAASVCSVEDIHRWHLNKGWSGIGYHFLVRKDGTIHEGRPLEYIGAHAYGSNHNSIGICCEGNFETEQMTDAQVEAVRWLINYLKEKYGNLRVRKHLEVCKTSCPGKNYRFAEVTNADIKPAVNEKKERIKELQRLLNKVYGTKLAIDGIIGEKTNKALRRVALKNYTANELVTFVQRLLIMNGRSVGVYGADGKYGQATANAVRKFQKEKGLIADGIAGINTIKILL